MTLSPLLTAAEGFPALERLAATARSELLLAFRIFDPRTRLRSPELRDEGLETWGDLLGSLTRRGVALRLLLADFDPVFTPELHRQAWAAASEVARAAPGDVQVLCAAHGQEAGVLWRLLMRRRIAGTVASMRREEAAALTPVQRALLDGRRTLRPATLHQKFAIADSERCIIGGLDINERRYDTPDHDRPPEETWHDLAMGVEDAGFSATLRQHFAECWNAALDCGTPGLGAGAERRDATLRPQSPPDLTLVRTVSEPCPGAARLSPRVREAGHETAMLALIEGAERHLYIETQFLRHAPIADALAVAARRRPGLQLVIVLPPFAERVLFEDHDGWDARHGHALQTDALQRLTRAYGDRLALISPGLPRAAPEEGPEIHGSGPVYVHSKLALADDRTGLLGSANLNGRSLRWDTEASVLFHRPDTVRALRERLARKWLGPLGEGDTTQAALWRQAALTNAARDPAMREGFALPYPLASGRSFARRFALLPDEMF